MAQKISPEARLGINGIIDEACKDPTKGLPNVAFVVVNKDGQEILTHAAGKRGIGENEPVSPDSVYWIASLTKLITAIACMQLVEQGRLELDSEELVEKVCPELKDVLVLQQDGSLVPKDKGITLRMLLSHTAGFGYSFMREELKKYDEFTGNFEQFKQPLVNQPGKTWEYGISLDWAGIIVERTTDLTLDEYFQNYIFGPLGLKNIGFFPSENMAKRLVGMNQRTVGGSLNSRPLIYRHPLGLSGKVEGKKKIFNSGGAGCFATARDYAQILATLLNNGTSSITGKQILSKSSVDEMFRNQIPDMPDFGRVGSSASKPELINPLPELFPLADRAPQGWGFAGMITPAPTGRTATSVYWAGIANSFSWCDREKGVAGVITTQIVPFGDLEMISLWLNVETMVYNSLDEK